MRFGRLLLVRLANSTKRLTKNTHLNALHRALFDMIPPQATETEFLGRNWNFTIKITVLFAFLRLYLRRGWIESYTTWIMNEHLLFNSSFCINVYAKSVLYANWVLDSVIWAFWGESDILDQISLKQTFNLWFWKNAYMYTIE